MESNPCFFCWFVIGVLSLFFCGRGFYKDYFFYKSNNWDWDKLNKDDDLRVDGGSENNMPIKGPVRFFLYFVGFCIGLILIVLSTFKMFAF